MSGDAKYISLYYSLVHQGASDFYKEIIKGPGGNMSYLPPWAPSSGGGHYPPHMLPTSSSTSSTSSGSLPPSHTTNNTTSQGGLNTPSVYQTLSPVVKTSSPTSVSVTQSINTPKTSTLPTSGAPASSTTSSTAAQSSGTTMSLGDPYEPQGFQRPHTPPKGSKNENPSMSDAPPPEMLLALAGPSSMDLKTPRKAPAKHLAPEQLASPVMFSYQGRGRPRKNWTHATTAITTTTTTTTTTTSQPVTHASPLQGLPTMIPVTHPSMHAGTTDDPDDEENRPFKCNLCGKGFKLKGGLVQHERTHSTDRPYVCPECGKLFRQPTHLQQHIRIHTGDKPYDCAFCGKSFRQRTILNQHLRIHTGEKPYVCMECGKSFRQKAILDQHFRTHLGEKPYACPHPSCRKHFREMAALISHMKCHKDVPDPRIVLQQAKRIKEERHEDARLDPQILGEHDVSDRSLGQEVMALGRIGLDRVQERMGQLGQDRASLGPDRVALGQDRGGLGQERGGLGQERGGLGQERGGLGQEVLSPERSHGHEHSEGSSTGSEQSYQGNGEQVQHEQARGFPQHNVNSSSAQKSPHSSLSQHSTTDRQSQPSPSQSLTSPLPPNMMPTPQMAMANLIPYPHSIFPATSYMMPPPDPRQYHPQSQGQHPSRPNQ
ncbi:zinc finger protein 8-like isoform X2 [Portunus trituberculatus]|uniref:zinc finger protein 8-like isoform X2 n=1 Tax=Portunus trituberculatus TaxID=210409 RepID=UPI001E1CF95D|nr:zinc finger protein 8-like isoform X2 [Portunus trituberculatus]